MGLPAWRSRPRRKGLACAYRLLKTIFPLHNRSNRCSNPRSFNVYTTDLGEEGIDLGKIYDYDIILLDLNLPDMSGFQVLRSLRVSKVRTPTLDPLGPCRHRGQG